MGKKIGFLPIGIVLVTLFTITCIPLSALAEPIKLNYAGFGPPKAFPCLQAERWKEIVEKKVPGKVAIKTFPSETLLSAKNIMDGVIEGQADIGVLCTAYQPGRFFVTNAASLPLEFPDSRVASLTLWDMYQKYKPEEFAKVKVLAWFSNPPSNIISKKPIRNLEDLKGFPLRASGGAAAALKVLGANPIGMPQPETPEALQKGVVQGVFTSLECLKLFNYAESCRYVTMINRIIYPFVVVMNKDKWNSLPKDVQDVMEGMGREHTEWIGVYNDNFWKEALDWSKKKYNVQVIELSQQELAKWGNLLQPLINQWIEEAKAKGLPAEAILSDIRAFRDKYSK